MTDNLWFELFHELVLCVKVSFHKHAKRSMLHVGIVRSPFIRAIQRTIVRRMIEIDRHLVYMVDRAHKVFNSARVLL